MKRIELVEMWLLFRFAGVGTTETLLNLPAPIPKKPTKISARQAEDGSRSSHIITAQRAAKSFKRRAENET